MTTFTTWPTTIALPVRPTRPTAVPEFKRTTTSWMASGAARSQMERCFDIPADFPLGWIENEAKHLDRAANFFVTAEMGQVLAAAAPTFPIDSTVDEPITDHGFLAFAEPVPLWSDRTDALIGLYWRAGRIVPMISGSPNDTYLITLGVPLDLNNTAQNRAGWSRAEAEAWKILACCISFLSQRIAVPTPVRIDRAARRRILRCSYDGPLEVNLIELRRPTRAESSGLGSTVAWQSRWIVGGFWRQQWYPSRGEHRPVWIAPYVKGPMHLPLVVRESVHVWRR